MRAVGILDRGDDSHGSSKNRRIAIGKKDLEARRGRVVVTCPYEGILGLSHPPEAVSAGTGDAESTGVTSERSKKSSLERGGEHVWNGEEEGEQEGGAKEVGRDE